jgi:hypothetical protein
MTEQAPSTQPLPGLLARAIGIITSPRATFERVVQTPKILGMLALVAILAGIGSSAFTFTTAGQQAFVDAGATQIEKFFGRPATDVEVARIEKQAPYQSYIALGSSLIVLPIVIAIIAGVFFLVFNVAMGGTATFKQVYAVVTHASILSVLALLFAVPIQFARGVMSLTGPANLSVLVPMLPENSFLSTFLGSIDLFRLWWTVVIAIGLGVLYKRSWKPITLTLLAIYMLFAVCIAFFFSGR